MSTPNSQPRLPKSIPRQPTTPAPNPTPTTFLKRRSGIWAGGIAVIVIAGTWFGATLKTSNQIEERKTIKEKAEVDIPMQVALLEDTRSRLMTRKVQLEKKIDELRESQRKTAEASKERESRMEAAKEGVAR